MQKSYFRELAEYFYNYSVEDIDQEALYQVKRALVNYLSGSVYVASHQSCKELLSFIREMDNGKGSATVWADEKPIAAPLAAFSNAARLSSIELNDSTNGSAHPGIYVWSAVLATYEQYGGSVEDVIRAVVFGYDVCSRMAMLSIDKVLEMGLHNPGIMGGLGAVSAAGLLRGLDVDQLCNAFGIVASLIPVCPFVSFVEGADSKDLYGGWGAYLGMLAVEAASKGLTGPDGVLHGVKSLKTLFAGTEGRNVKPGEHFYIKNLNIKQFPACFAINPAVRTVFALQEKLKIDPEQIKSVLVDSYPYSYDLNEGVGRNPNTISGRLSLYYTVAVALIDGSLTPEAFTQEKLHNPRYKALRDKIITKRHDQYGDGPKGIRGCIIEVTMKDGTVHKAEVDATNHKVVYSDEALWQRFCGLTEATLDANAQKKLYDFAMNLDKEPTLEPILVTLRKLKVVCG